MAEKNWLHPTTKEPITYEEFVEAKHRLNIMYERMMPGGDLPGFPGLAAKIKRITQPATVLHGESEILEACRLHYNFYGNWRPVLDRVLDPRWSSLEPPYFTIASKELFARIDKSAAEAIKRGK